MVDIINKTKYRLPQKLINQTLLAGAKFLKIKKKELSVVFVGKNEIKKLNKKYRAQDKPTDVLSFSYQYDENFLNGEIIICYSIAMQNARRYHHSLNNEISKLLAHSLLHLVGYDHKKAKDARQMEELEDKIINH